MIGGRDLIFHVLKAAVHEDRLECYTSCGYSQNQNQRNSKLMCGPLCGCWWYLMGNKSAGVWQSALAWSKALVVIAKF